MHALYRRVQLQRLAIRNLRLLHSSAGIIGDAEGKVVPVVQRIALDGALRKLNRRTGVAARDGNIRSNAQSDGVAWIQLHCRRKLVFGSIPIPIHLVCDPAQRLVSRRQLGIYLEGLGGCGVRIG